MIKRKDGSYSQRGLWDNIRANRGSGKKPTSEMLKQERKIKAKMQDGGEAEPPMTYTTVNRGEYKGRIFADREVNPLVRQARIEELRSLSRAGKINSFQKQAGIDSVTTIRQMRNPNIISSKPKGGRMCTPEEIKNGNCRNKEAIHRQAEGGTRTMQMGGMSGSPVVDMINQSTQPAMMQVGGMMPQTSAGQSVLKEAMMSKMQDGGKMPNSIARARFMAAANGNVSKAKETASKYGYKMQGGGVRFNPVQMDSSKPGFDFAKASAVATSTPAEEIPTDIERMAPVDIKKKLSFSERMAGKYRQAKKALGMDPYPKSGFKADLAEVTGELKAKEAAQQAASKKANRNYLQKIGDEFPTYLNLTADRNVLTDLADMGTMAAAKLGAPQVAVQLQQGKQAVQEFGNSTVGKIVDAVNPLSIGANLVGGSVGTAGDVAAGQGGDATSRAGKTAALALTKGIAGKVAGAGTSKLGQALNKVPGTTALTKKIGHSVQHGLHHQATHAGQHQLLYPFLAHKKGGTIKDMYMMKNGGQFPDRYKKMGFKGVDQPKRTTSGNKSHAVVTKVDGDYKLIRFGQKGVSGSPDGSARNKAFKARHAKNIAKGKSSAAYWANKVKW